MPHFIEPTFPQELLDAPQENRIAYFAQKGVAHDFIVSAYELAKDNIDFGTPGEIIPIVGPTGVGTTKLGCNLWHHYQRQGREEEGHTGAPNTCFPIGVDAPSQAGKVNREYWKRLLIAMLHKGGDVLIDQKIYVPPSEFILTHSIPWVDPRRGDIDTLLRSVVSMLKMRKTKVLFINQAHRLFPDGDAGGCSMSQQMLTDLAAQTQARIVLIGDYGLVREPAGGLDWFHRQLIVHFRRYDKRDSEEIAAFISAVEELLGSMPLPDGQRMKRLTLNDAEQIYHRSVGCFGGCKRPFKMALHHGLCTGEKITTEFLLRFMMSVKSAKKIAIDALQGEHMLMDEDGASLAKLLEFGMAVGGAQTSRASASGAKPAKSSPGYARPRIGERKPTRDPVGAVYAKRA